MKLHRITFLVCLIVLLESSSVFGQSTSNSHLVLTRRTPDGWFSLQIPKLMGGVERHADVDGGFYISDVLEIDYDYWTYENTPNFLRNATGTCPKPPMLACQTKSRQIRTLRTVIDGKRAIIQRCSETDARRRFRYIYYVTFPKLKVYDGEGFRYGMFNLTITYKNRRYSSVADRIVRSINFER
jgi:hypothetical protein